MGNKRPAVDAEATANKVHKVLSKLTLSHGHSMRNIFEDWTAIVEASLRMRPAHFESLREAGHMAEDGEEDLKLWKRVNDRYCRPEERADGKAHYAFSIFMEALNLLEQGAEEDWEDALGSLYMFHSGIPEAGQFFTPWDIALMMARMSVEDSGPNEVYGFIRGAIERNDQAREMMAASDPEATAAGEDAWFWYELMPIIYKDMHKLSISDPAVGSGVMLLAAASCFPRWMTGWGLVEFYGQDIDYHCATMAKINMMLYGLNGYTLRLGLAGGLDMRPKGGVGWSKIYGKEIAYKDADATDITRRILEIIRSFEPVVAHALTEPSEELTVAAPPENDRVRPALEVKVRKGDGFVQSGMFE